MSHSRKRINFIIFSILVTGTITLVRCGNNGNNNANNPQTCGSGLFLYYNGSTYTCNAGQAGVGVNGLNNGFTNGTYPGALGQGYSSAPPAGGCPLTYGSNQPEVLVNWCGTWMCRTQQELMNPTGCVAQGLGGESCTVGSIPQGYGSNPYNPTLTGTYNGYQTGLTGTGISCASGFNCDPLPYGGYPQNVGILGSTPGGGQIGYCGH